MFFTEKVEDGKQSDTSVAGKTRIVKAASKKISAFERRKGTGEVVWHIFVRYLSSNIQEKTLYVVDLIEYFIKVSTQWSEDDEVESTPSNVFFT